nr:MAG TPA: hypothetical protein [Caudoviricetes sp.]
MLARMEYYARVSFAPVLVPTLLRYTLIVNHRFHRF